jgi:preprotein translocase subunit YajC
MQMFPFILMIVVFYFILIRPQQKKAKEHQELLKQVKGGDKILTSSGIVGTVVTVKERTVSIRSADTKLEILKSAISEVTERSGESTES